MPVFQKSMTLLAAAVFIVAMSADSAHTQITTFWTPGGANTFFHNPGNWNNGVPGSADTAVFGVINSFQVTMNSNAFIKEFEHPIGTMTLRGGNRLAVGATPDLDGFLIIEGSGTEFEGQTNINVGVAELGDLRIENGGLLTTAGTLHVGFNNGIQGRLTVNGSGSKVESDGIRIGSSGLGELRIGNRGVVNGTGSAWIGLQATSNSEATVTGIDSEWNVNATMAVGLNGTGTLNIENQGAVNITGSSVIVLGNTVGSLGTLNLRDTNSSLNAPVIQIGNNGSGFLNLDLNAEANATTVNVGAGEFGDGTLNIDGSATLNAINVRIGSASNGEMLVENGLVNCTSAIVGNLATAVGTATLQSTNAILMCDSLTVGNSGSGDLFLADGGSALTNNAHVNDSSQIIFQHAGSGFAGTLASTSPVTVEGNLIFLSGQGEVAGSVVTSGNGQIQVGATASGTIFGNLTNNGLRVLVSPTGNLDVQGDWTGDSPFIGVGNVMFNGAARPGNGIGSVTFQGSVLMGIPAVLEIEIAGVNAGSQYDQMLIGGDVDLFGSLDVTMLSGFQPQDGQVFTIMEIGGTRSGLFAGLNEGDVVEMVNNVELAITYQGGDGNDIALQAHEIAFTPGDVNLDGSVDLLDVSPFVNLLTSGQYQVEADINLDGNVDLLDISLFVDLLTGG